MALSPSTITASIIAAAPFPGGPTFPQVATAIGNAVYAWTVIPSNVLMQGVTTGVAGAGVVLGKVIVPPNPALAISVLTSSGTAGPTASLFGIALGVGIPTAFASAQYAGPSVGVSAGADASKVTVANPVTLIPLILAQLIGPSSIIVAPAIANVVSSLLLTGTGVGVVTPVAAAPGPAVGTSPFSVMF